MTNLSIIIPTLNSAHYLKECIDSVLNQLLRDIEIIVVDANSTDGTLQILQDYAKSDSRISLIISKHKSYGYQMNLGIAKARGEYIGIVESDDFIKPTMFEKLYTKAKQTNAKLVKCNFFVYDSHSKVQNKLWKDNKQNLSNAPSGVFNPCKDFPQIFYFHASIWAGIYKADFIKQIKLLETAGAAYQDFPFAMEILTKATKMAVIKEPLYHWRMETNQNNSTQANPEKLTRMANMTLISAQVLARELDELKEYFFYHAAMANMGFFDKQSLKGRKIYAYKMYEVFALYKNPQFTHFKPKLKVWTQTIMQGKVPKLPFKELRRCVFRLRFRKDEIHIKLGNFEIKKSFENG